MASSSREKGRSVVVAYLECARSDFFVRLFLIRSVAWHMQCKITLSYVVTTKYISPSLLSLQML